MAELRNGLFIAVEECLRLNAPLLLDNFNTAHRQATPYDKYYDDVPAFEALRDMQDNVIANEPDDHDMELVALKLKPLSDGATPQEFSARVNRALTLHIPYLSRPFSNPTDIGKWVLQLLPSNHAVDGRADYRLLSAAEKAVPATVAKIQGTQSARTCTLMPWT